MQQFYQFVASPIGMLEVCASDSSITAISFVECDKHTEAFPNDLTDEACAQLEAYFEKRLSKFDLPLQANGTDFQRKVWAALMDIPYGNTASYADIAKSLQNPNAVRAVGMANGRNPIAIVVPCHRVIGSDNSLTGYASGVERKQFLLKLEGAQGVLWV